MSENHSLSSLAAVAEEVLRQNWRDGFTVPSPRLYPFQWNWDSAFIALGLAYFAPQRALWEIRSMFAGQWSNGLLPHINFHQPNENYFPGPEVWQTRQVPAAPRQLATSGITQPPVYAFALERMLSSPAAALPEWPGFLREIFPKILAFHRYLYTRRDPAGEGLVYIQHNWESGTDNSPLWYDIFASIDVTGARDVSGLRRDVKNVPASHRPSDDNYNRYIYLVDLFIRLGYDDRAIAANSPFLVQDVLFNSLLVRSNRSLIKLGLILGLDTGEIQQWNARSIAAINRKLWDPVTGFYYAYDLKAERPIRIKTSSGFIPLFAGICLPGQAAQLVSHLNGPFTCDGRWRYCPSTAADEPSFDPIRYWRGPIWTNVNWMLYHGLLRYGESALAERVKSDTLDQLASAGRFEYFDARLPRGGIDGPEGLGADNFSWSAALCLDLLGNAEMA